MSRKKHAPVCVEWVDAVVREGGWMDAEKAATETAPHPCVSFGHLIRMDDAHVTVALTHSAADGADEVNQTIVVPASWVTGVWEMRKGKRLR